VASGDEALLFRGSDEKDGMRKFHVIPATTELTLSTKELMILIWFLLRLAQKIPPLNQNKKKSCSVRLLRLSHSHAVT